MRLSCKLIEQKDIKIGDIIVFIPNNSRYRGLAYIMSIEEIGSDYFRFSGIRIKQTFSSIVENSGIRFNGDEGYSFFKVMNPLFFEKIIQNKECFKHFSFNFFREILDINNY